MNSVSVNIARARQTSGKVGLPWRRERRHAEPVFRTDRLKRGRPSLPGGCCGKATLPLNTHIPPQLRNGHALTR